MPAPTSTRWGASCTRCWPDVLRSWLLALAIAGVLGVAVALALVFTHLVAGSGSTTGAPPRSSASTPASTPLSVPSAVAHFTQVVVQGERNGTISQSAGDDLLK